MRRKMSRNLKRLGCAILCACLLMINAPVPMSYAGNTEQQATDTDATETDAAYAEAEETTQTATDTDAGNISATAGDAADINTSSVMGADVLLYTASSDVPDRGGYKLEINSQTEWETLFTHISGDGSGWYGSGTTATYIENTNPVTIILNADISLSADTTLTIPPIDSVPKDFLLSGRGHSINTNGHKLVLQAADAITVDNVQLSGGGTLMVSGHNRFNCTNSNFDSSSIAIHTSNVSERAYITGCNFSNCTSPCVNSNQAPCPVSFSDCNMDACGALYKSAYPGKVSFAGITATNCTGTVFGQTDTNSYLIEAISDCKLSTQTTGITAIWHKEGAIGSITDCTITGFDTGIKLENCKAISGDIDTLAIKDTKILDCITGLHTKYLNSYQDVIFSDLEVCAREGASNTTGYNAEGALTSKTIANVDYDFDQLPQIKQCIFSGFDMGISTDNCPAFISFCNINSCIKGISISGDPVAVAYTSLTAPMGRSDSCGIYTNNRCYLIDCVIRNYFVGSDFSVGNRTTVIGCSYENNTTNLKTSYTTDAYDTSFTGGQTSVAVRSGQSYFYDCVVKGKNTSATSFGYSLDTSSSVLHVYSLARPYQLPSVEYCYDKIKHYSQRTVTDGKSEISDCMTGINSTNSVYIADTHIHDCGTGIKSTSDNFTSYGNNLIEGCTDGMILSKFDKRTHVNSASPLADVNTDIIRNCSHNGVESSSIYSEPTGWDNRLEIYNCGNYGINVASSNMVPTSVTVNIHDCKTGIYVADNTNTIVLGSGSKIYNSREWNVYDSRTGSGSGSVIIQGQDDTLTGGKLGNIYSNRQAIISVTDLYSDDSVYYLGTDTVMFIFSVVTLNGTAVFDTTDSGYILGRRIAGLNADVTSQMFAKKEGFIISSEKEGTTTYAIFAAGCNVTYDVTTNGGDTFHDGSEAIRDGNQTQSNTDGSLTRISYLDGSDIDLSYTASKTGYEFVGWNTDPDATEGLDSLTAGRKDITLYAIYKKTAYINYYTYDTASDYKAAVTFYNNQDEIERRLAAYNAGGDNTFVGYVLDEDATISSADDVMAEGSDIMVSPDGLDVYCVYEKQGQLNYLKKDGSILGTDKVTVYQISSDNKNFVYTLRAGEPVKSFTFKEWKDAAGNSYAAGSTLNTEDNLIVLTPVYKASEEPNPDKPTTEEPTPDKPTTEEPTPDKPTTEKPDPEPPIIQPPATDAPTQTPSGPKTGDSAAPIAVMVLGFMSLLGIVGLSLKNKRKH